MNEIPNVTQDANAAAQAEFDKGRSAQIGAILHIRKTLGYSLPDARLYVDRYCTMPGRSRAYDNAQPLMVRADMQGAAGPFSMVFNWNHRDSVVKFAKTSDEIIRAGGRTELYPISAGPDPVRRKLLDALRAAAHDLEYIGNQPWEKRSEGDKVVALSRAAALRDIIAKAES